MNFGEIIKRKRAEKGYTLEDMARLTGKKVPNISDLETRRGDDPRYSTMKTFAKALGLNFVISADETESIKSYDVYKDIEIQGIKYDDDDIKFLQDPTSQSYVLLAKWIKKFGLESDEVKDFAKVMGIKK